MGNKKAEDAKTTTSSFSEEDRVNLIESMAVKALRQVARLEDRVKRLEEVANRTATLQ
ncbi:hypothetical protein [Flexibacterium corallicola]|uniref:hypothetical protein n=1 Tax=Flexibacterium corallicola TaxID=3037259 RepID=UPI00286F2F5D|nr:hypothetical protein [Pseudovibrio sp. M1P-2-3]